MRTAALPHPPQHEHPFGYEDDDAFYDADRPSERAPRESMTRLIAAPVARPEDSSASAHGGPSGTFANARPTLPVPAFYLFQAQLDADVALDSRLATQLEELGQDPDLVLPREWQGEAAMAAFEEPTRTRMVVPLRRVSTLPPPRTSGVFSLLAYRSSVPYLRHSPRDIPRATIDHGRAFVLAFIDGQTTLGELLETSPMPVPQVLRVVNGLLDSGIIGLRA